MSEVNWLKIRNAIRRRFRTADNRQWLPSVLSRCAAMGIDVDDMVQDACGFCVKSIAAYDDTSSKVGAGYTREQWIGVAICRAAGRAKRGQSIAYKPAKNPSWCYREHPHYIAKYAPPLPTTITKREIDLVDSE